MASGSEIVRSNARNKGTVAAIWGAATLAMVGAWMFAGLPMFAVATATIGGVVTGRHVYEWLRYRGEWGLRF